jgi:hypothetical protein
MSPRARAVRQGVDERGETVEYTTVVSRHFWRRQARKSKRLEQSLRPGAQVSVIRAPSSRARWEVVS